MNIQWTHITQQEFLEQYWQKKPVVLKAAVENFEDPIDANDLAGLAMEEVVESRIVSKITDTWKVEHGPFADYQHLPKRGWSLLVQGVDRWFSQVNEIRSLVDFLPKWQIDDVMVSYSTEFGGVGAHLDQYDVFILQGQGKRHWQVGSVDKNLTQQETCPDLLQVETFEPRLDVILEPGDILYIPPFAPHCGTTITDSLSYSIGFRAPSQTELLTSFADYIFENELGKARYQTVASALNSNEQESDQSALSKATVESLRDFMLDSLKQGQFDKFLHQFLTEPTRELDIAPSDMEWTEQQILQLCQSNDVRVEKVLGLQTSFFSDELNLHFYINGTYFKLEHSQLAFIKDLHQSQSLDNLQLKSSLTSLENISLLTTLINTGYLFIDE